MDNSEALQTNITPHIHWGHFAIISLAIVLLGAITWLEKPELFSLKNNPVAANTADVPHYYAYVEPASDQPQPAVLGASTDGAPDIINEDGSVSPVDMGQVLGASTQDVELPLADIKVNSISDSADGIQKYMADSKTVENGPVDNAQFEQALVSNDQSQINIQADKFVAIVSALQKMPVPESLVKLDQLTIAQYNAAIGVLQNFTQANSNPELVGQYLQQFLKSQVDLDAEQTSVELLVQQKYNIDLGFPTTNPDDNLASASSQTPDPSTQNYNGQ